MAAPFSRLQLAAALLEYDGDRSAQDSAIFLHLRRHPARPPVLEPRSGHLSVALPSETESVLSKPDGKRKSRASTIGPLRNPFGADDAFDEEHEEHDEQEFHEEEGMEVDLTSWGLDAFISKEKGGKGKGKAKSLSSPQPLSAVQAHFPKTSDVLGDVQRRPRATRSMSVGNYDYLSPAEETRRKSFGSPLDLSGMDVPADFQRPIASTSQSSAYDGLAIDNEEAEQVMGSIPFPSTSVRSPSPMTLDYDRQRRTYSTASLDSKMAMNTARARVSSSATMDIAQDNPFALAPPSRASKFDPKAAAHAHGRTLSNASLGSRMLLENDGASVMTSKVPPQENRYSTTLELLRPKLLVMPSPLQSANAPPSSPKGRDGFLMADTPPLPPGARTSRTTSLGAANVLVPSNSFTPNPRLNLSLSQLTFRNMPVGGMRDVSYNDIDGEIPRAVEEGEQVQMSTTPTVEMDIVLPIPSEDTGAPRRPAGKLYGKSLIDDLENRKQQMKSKQRYYNETIILMFLTNSSIRSVFKGDDRPSMMARNPLQRASTLIDPATLQDRPGFARPNSVEPTSLLSRRISGHAGPLLTFDNDNKVPHVAANKSAINRSVFGVDTVWERELAKLRKIEAEEAFERERQQALEETEALKKGKKKKKGKKGKINPEESLPAQMHKPFVSQETSPVSAISSGPPVLPIIQAAIKGPPPAVDDDSDSEESFKASPAHAKSAKVETWYEQSSDEEGRPRRTTGVGLRYPSKQSSLPRIQTQTGDSEEDLPLAATIGRAVQRTTRLAAEGSDSDEEKPLSTLISKASLPSINFDSLLPAVNDEDDDNQPLGLRASRMLPNSSAHDEDDDRPLGLHPVAEQRRTQYQMMAQHQMMMQAQMHNSMFFNPSMSGFFAPPPMAIPPIQAPIPIPSPPPVQDIAKLGRVDRWRHDVAIEGE
ncbi:hypothetical protein D9757_000039 [Collybiopsis confluens]|uniref:Uncharacterized protein n=1 Tax=Collybiopsis confluens TaxID=2823264 RepID=A0A8H5I2H1_9AGAR|nr:hypothetical protein D9757_000039 [Collybiopsis confluens]